MAIEQPNDSDPLSAPSHGAAHRIIAVDSSAAVRTIQAGTTQLIFSAPADGVNAIQFNKADLTTNILKIDTTNEQIIVVDGTRAAPAIVHTSQTTMGWYRSAINSQRWAMSNNDYWQITSSALGASSGNRARFVSTDATATAPSICPSNDTDTGIGLAAADQLSLIAGGVEGIRVVEADSVVRIGIGIAAPLAKVHIDQSVSDAAIPVLSLDQADLSEGFVNFIGTSAASAVGPISSWSAGNSIQGFVRVEINGVQRWMPYYDDPTS